VHQSESYMITSNASEKIALFNKIGLHYNLVADAIYRVRQTCEDPFSNTYLPYIVAGLMSFDMTRMMGKDPLGRYDINAEGFAARLEKKLNLIKPAISYLVSRHIEELDLVKDGTAITEAYDLLAASGDASLNYRGGRFPVGASKILHFLNPNAFIIIDSNAACAFKASHNVSFRDSTQPGYSGKKYVECLGLAQAHISEFGLKAFSDLESDTPLCRIYDKLTFITGVQIKNQ
jgi:hypothetical protein